MLTAEQTKMHQEHREADTEIESWLDDIHMWRAEQKQAIAWLAEITAALHSNDAQMQQHEAILEKQVRHIRQHEHAIATKEEKNRIKDQTQFTHIHQTFNDIQAKARQQHATIGDFHRQQIADLNRAYKQLCDLGK